MGTLSQELETTKDMEYKSSQIGLHEKATEVFED